MGNFFYMDISVKNIELVLVIFNNNLGPQHCGITNNCTDLRMLFFMSVEILKLNPIKP